LIQKKKIAKRKNQGCICYAARFLRSAKRTKTRFAQTIVLFTLHYGNSLDAAQIKAGGLRRYYLWYPSWGNNLSVRIFDCLISPFCFAAKYISVLLQITLTFCSKMNWCFAANLFLRLSIDVWKLAERVNERKLNKYMNVCVEIFNC